jgi:hypothetical protein
VVLVEVVMQPAFFVFVISTGNDIAMGAAFVRLLEPDPPCETAAIPGAEA